MMMAVAVNVAQSIIFVCVVTTGVSFGLLAGRPTNAGRALVDLARRSMRAATRSNPGLGAWFRHGQLLTHWSSELWC